MSMAIWSLRLIPGGDSLREERVNYTSAHPERLTPQAAHAMTRLSPARPRRLQMTSRRARTVLIVLGVLIVLAVLAGLLGVLTVRRSFPQTAGTLQVPGLEHPVEVFRDA